VQHANEVSFVSTFNK